MRKPLSERLKTSLREGVAFSQGKLDLRTVAYPEEPPEIDAAAVTPLRERAALSQAVFARLLNVSTKTVQSCEQGTRKPSQASRRLIQIFRERPEIVLGIVGLAVRESEESRDDRKSRKKRAVRQKTKQKM